MQDKEEIALAHITCRVNVHLLYELCVKIYILETQKKFYAGFSNYFNDTSTNKIWEAFLISML